MPFINWFPIPRIGQTMDTKARLSLCCLLLVPVHALCQAKITHGIVKVETNGRITLVTPSPLQPTDEVYFQYQDGNEKMKCCHRLSASAFDRVDAPEASNEINPDALVSAKARIPQAWASEPFIGAAVAGSNLSVRLGPNRGLIAVKNGSDAAARTQSNTCVSQEGFHLMSKSKGSISTHLYLGFGYEVEKKTCK